MTLWSWWFSTCLKFTTGCKPTMSLRGVTDDKATMSPRHYVHMQLICNLRSTFSANVESREMFTRQREMEKCWDQVGRLMHFTSTPDAYLCIPSHALSQLCLFSIQQKPQSLPNLAQLVLVGQHKLSANPAAGAITLLKCFLTGCTCSLTVPKQQLARYTFKLQ